MTHDKAISTEVSYFNSLDKNTTYTDESAYFSLGLSDTYIPIPVPVWVVYIRGIQADNPPFGGGNVVGGHIQVNAITGNTRWIDEIM